MVQFWIAYLYGVETGLLIGFAVVGAVEYFGARASHRSECPWDEQS